MRSRVRYLMFFVVPVALAAPLAVPLQPAPSLGGPNGLPIETLGASPAFFPGDCALGPSGEILGPDGCAGLGEALDGGIAFPRLGGDEGPTDDPMNLLSGAPDEPALAEGAGEMPRVALVEEAFWKNAEQNGFGAVGPVSLIAGGSGGSLYFSSARGNTARMGDGRPPLPPLASAPIGGPNGGPNGFPNGFPNGGGPGPLQPTTAPGPGVPSADTPSNEPPPEDPQPRPKLPTLVEVPGQGAPPPGKGEDFARGPEGDEEGGGEGDGDPRLPPGGNVDPVPVSEPSALLLLLAALVALAGLAARRRAV